ncbi:adenylate/guanylate cyclase domain-containing protein [Roseibium sp. RKSG952]|uniref:adenylate/guanylate cyclase domain-containing protein n=1 Tax=Roseibium sp. RKSG952 TaxID=2529384 RepID=UPI001FCB71C8|nr:adenylate/guanylate cyclase domain-containing protein [Roseibium sp. RKSG952]
MRISWKIFGVSLLVFLVMAASAVYSIYKISKINSELQAISGVFAPLTEDVTRIEIIALREELHLERIEKLEAELRGDRLEGLAEGKTADEVTASISNKPGLSDRLEHLEERLKKELEVFEARSKEVSQLFIDSEDRVRGAQASSTSTEERLELAALLPSLISLELQHKNFHSHARNLIEAANMSPEMRESLEEQLEAQETQLTGAIEDVRSHVASYTSGAIRKAADHEQQALYATAIATVAAGILALLLSYAVISGILRPMRELAQGTRKVAEGDLSVKLTPLTRDEIGELTERFNSMVKGLQSTQKIKDTFGQYVDPRVVSGLIGEGPEAVAGEKKVVSAFFSDLANFTSISEQFTPASLVRMLNRYLDLMSLPITERQGVIDKYIGDSIMAFWAPPFCSEGDQATLAVQAAVDNVSRMPAFQEELPELTGLQKNLPALRQRIGIATGDAVVGSIGSSATKNYTVMGDTVNLGSRLEGANKIYGTSILVCERTRNMTSGVDFRLIDLLQVVGKTEPTLVYTPITGEVSNGTAIAELSEEALTAYADQRWKQAQDHFRSILDVLPGDSVAPVFLNRIELILRDGAPDNWDGVWHMHSK